MRNLNCALCLGYSLRPKAECCSQVQGHSFLLPIAINLSYFS